MITCILNGYRRPHRLEEQVKAVRNQSIPPDEIMLWTNAYPGVEISKISGLTTAACDKNLGVWARFAYALNAKTEYVCVIDDDTIPGRKWFENCINSIQKTPGLYGTRGLRFRNGSYFEHDVLGWESKNEQIEQVDIVGHAWCFRREWLAAYWSELPPPNFTVAGEDIHFSYLLQKRLGLNTYVPPHPANDPEMSGSLKPIEYGVGKEATSNFGMGEMQAYLQHAIRGGFKLMNK